MQVIFAPLYAWVLSGLGIGESSPFPPQKHPFLDSRSSNGKKAGGNMCETTGRLAQARRLRPKGVPYDNTHTRESQARNTKKLTERIPVSHTLNLLRNGKFFKKAI